MRPRGWGAGPARMASPPRSRALNIHSKLFVQPFPSKSGEKMMQKKFANRFRWGRALALGSAGNVCKIIVINANRRRGVAACHRF